MAVAAQTFSKWIVVLSYEINKDYIAKTLCVNKGSCCKGKCYLHKELAADEDQQKSAGKSAITKDIQLQLFFNDFAEINVTGLLIGHHYNSFYINGKSQEFTHAFFQPPQCA
jgi:hypothetical protein